MNARSWVLTVSLVMGVLGLVSEARASTAIQSAMNGKCVDVPRGDIKPGTQLVMWDCHGGTNQKFQPTPAGELRIGGLCVDALGGSGRNGDPIGLWNCTGGANQKWRVQGNALRGINNRCIDIAGGNAGNGARIVLWDCHGGANQGWRVNLAAATPPANRPAPPAARPAAKVDCFGGVGNGCAGGSLGSIGIIPVARDIGGGRKKQWVNVGSILHDTCCHANPSGQHCKGWNAREEGRPDSAACVKEWRKALFNWRDKRSWEADFSADDYSPAPGRRATVFNGTGGRLGAVTAQETRSTRRLAAPSGTALDWGDEQFCASGQFARKGSAPFVGDWGICK
jgi:hypothetical protein